MEMRNNKPMKEIFGDDSMPPLPPWTILGHHVAQKFTQVSTFAFIGAAPLYWLYQTKLKTPPQPFQAGLYLSKYYPKTLGVSAAVGLAVGGYYVFSHLDEEEVTEQAYRLAHNHPNNRVEQRGLMVAGAGSLIYPMLLDKGRPIVTRMLRGASFGYAGGIIVALILEGFFKRQ